MQELRELAREAADLIERDGWVQSEYEIPGCGYCLLGAIRKVEAMAVGIHPDYLGITRTERELVHALGFPAIADLLRWNDKPGNTKERVLHRLRRVADGKSIPVNDGSLLR